MTNIAFIGLGNMGLPMAINLKEAGHDVTGFDAVAAVRDKGRDVGLQMAHTAEEAVGQADIVITMLPSGPIVQSVVSNILPAMRKGALLIDSSTIDVATARQVHEMAADAEMLCLDAPVSGGTGGAAAGTLTFMVGGSDDAFAKGEPVLQPMAGRIVHCGAGGTGQAAKICNNMLLGISMIGACEAFALAEKLGLSAQSAFDVISTSSGSCWSVNTYCPVPDVGPESPADRDYAPGFAASLMLKDLTLSQEAAENSGQNTPLGAHAKAIYAAFVDAGGGGADFSAIIEALKKTPRREIG